MSAKRFLLNHVKSTTTFSHISQRYYHHLGSISVTVRQCSQIKLGKFQPIRTQMTTTKESLPPLPYWESTPPDQKAAIREIKRAIRTRIEAAGRTVPEVFAVIEKRIIAQVEEITAEKKHGHTVWPVIEYNDIENGTVSKEQYDKVKKRGCLVVRGVFDREQALNWDKEITDYLELNKFWENYKGPGDDFFSTVDSKPEVYSIFWSKPHMEGRQHPRMARVQSYINRFWNYNSGGVQWFDPDQDSFYPDRIRRRPPGTNSAGLGSHIDSGTLDFWMNPTFQKALHHLYDGTVEQFDAWDAAHRTEGTQYIGSTMCSGFRTFQGWVALSDMDHDQGVLQTVPIAEALAYLVLRPLMPDVPEDDMCGVTVGKVFPITDKWHPLLTSVVTPIPDVKAGDSAWWFCDSIHSVGAVKDQKGWANVMYIPASPWCARNENYSKIIRQAFLTGSSPSDFPEEHIERQWKGRFGPQHLNDIGRRALRL